MEANRIKLCLAAWGLVWVFAVMALTMTTADASDVCSIGGGDSDSAVSYSVGGHGECLPACLDKCEHRCRMNERHLPSCYGWCRSTGCRCAEDCGTSSTTSTSTTTTCDSTTSTTIPWTCGDCCGDMTGDCVVMATDAAQLLRRAVNLPVALACDE
jgi:hypothetical protein